MTGLADVDRPLIEERQHPVRPWVLALALLVVVLAVASVFYYSPLEAGELGCAEPAQLVPAPESETGQVGRERCLLTAGREVEQVVLDVELVNAGRLPITVEGLALDAPVAELLRVMDTEEPFSLSPGETRRIDLVLEVAACDPDRGERLLTLAELPVRSRFLGIPKTTGATLDTELSVLRSRC
jgi:hypothetical protein